MFFEIIAFLLFIVFSVRKVDPKVKTRVLTNLYGLQILLDLEIV